MFHKEWVQAEAVILDELGYGNVVDRDFHGVDWAHYKYILEVRPPGEAPFRVETKVKVPIFSSPSRGDTVSVTFDPKSHQVEVRIEGDPRYDPKLIRAKRNQERQAREQALLGGAPVPAPPAAADGPGGGEPVP